MANKEEQGMPYPPYGYPYPPQMHMHPHTHPHMFHSQMQQQFAQQVPPPPCYGYPPQMTPPPPPPQYQQPQYQQPHHHDHGHDPMVAQSQAMLEGLMGDQAGMFKDLLHKLGVDDKEFWKGAMIGAAAALVLSNDNVRSNLMSLLGNAGDLLKTGGDKVKSAATNTASNVTGGVAMGADVFRDTVSAGTAGFKESVARHRSPEAEPQAEAQPEPQAPAEPVKADHE